MEKEPKVTNGKNKGPGKRKPNKANNLGQNGIGKESEDLKEEKTSTRRKKRSQQPAEGASRRPNHREKGRGQESLKLRRKGTRKCEKSPYQNAEVVEEGAGKTITQVGVSSEE